MLCGHLDEWAMEETLEDITAVTQTQLFKLK